MSDESLGSKMVEELRLEAMQELRANICRGINAYAKRKDIPYGVVWNHVYGTMTTRYGLNFNGVKVKLDVVEHAGLLGEMMRIINNMTL